MKKILLVELAGIGDAVLSTPAIRNLRTCFPGYYIGYLTFAGPAQLMRNYAYLDEIHILHKGKYFFKNLFVINKLRRMKIDIAVNLSQIYTKRGALKMAALLYLLGVKHKVGRDTGGKGFFYDQKVEDFLYSPKHDVEHKLGLVKTLGCKLKDRYPEVWLSESDKRTVKDYLGRYSIEDRDMLIGIHPSAFRPSRRWDWRNFAALGDILAKRYNAKIIITGAKEDQRLVRNIVLGMSSGPIDASGKLSLTELAALIKRCNYFIANDTAPMHIANAFNVPLIAIIGPGPKKTQPYNNENCVILKKDTECSPCYRFKCKEGACLKSITVEMAVRACEKLIEEYG